MSDLLRIGSSALNAAYVQLQTTGQNIANAGTPGYVRREVTLQETVSAGRSGMGGGQVACELGDGISGVRPRGISRTGEGGACAR